LGSQSPHNIILGLEPNFFITSAPVKLIGTGEELHGTSLFVSLSLMRIFSNEEFDAVIGHELGHFRGADTIYSLKFAPIYSRLSHALSVLSNTAGNASDLGKLPALAALALYLTRFAILERSVGRERELLADQAGASVGSERALATALLKVALFSANWNWLTQQHIAALAEGQTFTHLATTFSASAELSQDANWSELRNAVAGAIQAHPTDTHPTFAERVSALGLSPDALQPADCTHPAQPSVALVEGSDELDAQLSGLEANWLLAIGAAHLPQAA
jgi:Zn-dependent protease with chaperone function